MYVLLVLLTLVGHVCIWVALVNRVHATAMHYRMCKLILLSGAVCTLLIPAWYIWRYPPHAMPFANREAWTDPWRFDVLYGVACWTMAAIGILDWFRRHVLGRSPEVLRSHRSRVLKVPQYRQNRAPEDHDHHFLARLPRNEILHLDIAERGLIVHRLAAQLDRLSIVHISDLHFTGRVGKAYFQEVARICNEFDPDLVAITGDLVDNPRHIEWIPDTFGALRAQYGVYFVLGNHDLRCDLSRLRRTMVDCGLEYLGGRWLEIEVRGQRIILAGNELPWISPPADLSQVPARQADGEQLRIALSHSPDQIEWAQSNDVDLLLAGHLHGGQIRVPIIGPILSPSRHGVEYSSGVFLAPPTVMHVSRGISGEVPIRMNCPPEVTKLVLHVDDDQGNDAGNTRSTRPGSW